MPDYLSQLALRIQQPELAVQPRALSPFESPRYSVLEPSEPSEPGVVNEPRLHSDFFVAVESGEVEPRSQTSRRNEFQAVNPKLEVPSAKDVQSPYPDPSMKDLHEFEEIISNSEAQGGKEPQNRHLGQLTADLPISAYTDNGLKDPRQFSHEVAHPNLARQPTSQNERNSKREGEPIETAVRTMTSAETAGISSPILKRSKLSGETDESGLQPDSIVSVETSAVEPTPLGERSPQPEAPPAKKSRKPYADKLMMELPVQTDAARTEDLRRFLDEVTHPDLSKSPIQQNERNPKRAAESIEPAVQKDKSAEAVPILSVKSLEQGEFPWSAERTGQGQEKQIQPLVGIENRRERKSSSPSARATSGQNIWSDNKPSQAEPLLGPLLGHKDGLMPRYGPVIMPRTDVFRSQAEPPASLLAMEREHHTPTIQVTIGRVEIRATLPTPPSRKTLPTAPAMSLDDYLKQRNGGRR